MSKVSTTTEHLWEQLSGKLRSFLVQRVSDPEVAEDLLQETFLRIHTRVDDLENDQRRTAWVYQIARNLVIDHYRRKGHDHEATMLEEIDTLIDESTNGASTNLNVQAESWLLPMIGRLPEDYQEAIKQYELHGRPQQAIADSLGLSLSGAKSRVQRGRTQLKVLFDDCCSFEQDRRGNIIDYTPKPSKDGKVCCQEDGNL